MTEAPTLSEGTIIADTYQVTRLLGTGGMGEVWLAEHQRLPGKQVAIKVLHVSRETVSSDAFARFQREAQVATRIGHPNIVEVHDFNRLPSGVPYLVLEYLQGESLATRLRFGQLPLDEVTSIVRQLGSALSATHAKGVVHRDLKPDNIFLVPSPLGTVVKVLDFGISKLVDSSTLQTGDQLLVGTPQYMAPEQATGRNSTVGPQSDVFALGCIAYEMLCGASPFIADTAVQTLYRIAHEQHVAVLERRGDVPVIMASAIEGALKKDPKERTADAATFASEFSGSPVVWAAPPKSERERTTGVATPDATANVESMLAKTSPATPLAMAAPITASGSLLDTPLGDRAPYAVTSSTAPKNFRWVMVSGSGLALLLVAFVGFQLFGDDGRRLYGMKADSLAGDDAPVAQATAEEKLPPAETGGAVKSVPPPPIVVAKIDPEPVPARRKVAGGGGADGDALKKAFERNNVEQPSEVVPEKPSEPVAVAAAPGGPAAPPASTVAEDLAALEEAWGHQKYARVIELARSLRPRVSAEERATLEHLSLLQVQASCALKNVSDARLLLPKVAATDVGTVMTFCREQGAEL